MLWYLLFFFRGTTKPPVLSRDHPIRKAFFNYGTAAARQWLLVLLIQVAVGVVLCYPALFLYYDNPATGSSNLPHHVWTSARPHTGSQNIPPDIEMRQMWIYGSYMKVLDREVIAKALEIQNFVLGLGSQRETAEPEEQHQFGRLELDYGKLNDTLIPFDTKAGALTWGYHSPLLYWNCSMSLIHDDKDLLATINRQANRRTFMNLTMRPTSVFAGKTFEKNRLISADALVLTFFDDPSLGIGESWDKRMKELADYAPNLWSLFPDTGRVTGSKLYDFRFQPMSFNDDFALGVAYSMMAAYVLISLRKIRAVKSTFGLVNTVLVQTAASICGSFTICAILGFNLSQIPRAVYPFVVLVIGLENTFRLINAVLSYPLEMPVIFRVANALGDVGHLSLAAVASNLLLLWALSRVVSPDVASFCAFAAVALVIDFSFHLTFFLAVLSVDVKRMELKDSLDRANKMQQRTGSSPERKSSLWLYLSSLRPLPFSTRIAGSAAIVGFVSILNWHFFDWESQKRMLKQVVGLIPQDRNAGTNHAQMSVHDSIGQTRTPAAWLRMQDYHTAKEVISVVRPDSYSLLVRVFDPLMIVLSGTDRTGAVAERHTWLQRTQDLLGEHLSTFVSVLIFSVVFVVLLLRYMLYNDLPVVEDLADTEDSYLTVRDLPKPHELDIISLTACGKGQMVSVGLDRSTCIWSFDGHGLNFSHYKLPTPEKDPILWPIITSAVDDTGSLFALYCLNGNVAVWSITQRQFIFFTQLDIKEQPLLFSFKQLYAEVPASLRLLIVTTDGLLTELDFQLRHHHNARLCSSPLASVAVFESSRKDSLRLITVSRNGCIHLASRPDADWISEAIYPLNSSASPDPRNARPRNIASATALNVLAIRRPCELSLVILQPLAVIHTFQIGQAKPGSLRVLHSPRRRCPGCGGLAVYSFSAAYTESETGNCIVHTFAAADGPNSALCLQSGSQGDGKACGGFASATESLHWVENAGVWEACQAPAIIGIRKRLQIPASTTGVTSSALSENGTASFLPTLRSRKRRTKNLTQAQAHSNDDWEAYTLSTSGDFYTTPLQAPATQADELDPLFVACAGPICKLGARSVAVGFGNGVKVIALGHERFGQGGDGVDEASPGYIGSVSRRGKQNRRTL